MTGISLLRFMAVKFPLKCNLQARTTSVFLIFTWLVGIIIAAARFSAQSITTARIYIIVLFTLVYLIPLTCIVSVYAIVGYTLVKRRPESVGAQTSQSTPLSATVNRTIVITIVCFIVCYTPFMISNVMVEFKYAIPVWVGFVIRALFYTNSIVNFLVYTIKIQEFRLAAKSLVCCIKAPVAAPSTQRMT